MAYTPIAVSEIFGRVRHILSDMAEGSYRWTDAQLLLWFTDGQRDFCKRRPDAYVDSTTGAEAETVITPDPGKLTVITDYVSVHARFFGALTDYVLARCFAADSADTANLQRAEYHGQAYENAILKV